MTFEEFQSKFRVRELLILQNANWVMSVRPDQKTLGSLVVSTKHSHKCFSDVSLEAGNELLQLFTHAEKFAKQKFGAVRINVLCLMMQDPYVHFHIFPRYDKVITFAGETFKDNDWPTAPVLSNPAPKYSDEVLFQIRDELKL